MRPKLFKHMVVACFVFSSLLVFSSQAEAQSATLNGAMLGNACAGCHGTRGAPANEKIPPLAGMNPAQFTETMQAYRDGSQRGTIMNRVARAYSDGEIAAMAAYFAAFPADSNE